MLQTAVFILTNIGLGIGLAIDAGSVSLANGLAEPNMSGRKTMGIALVFSVFQGLMPMIGWGCVHLIETVFKKFVLFVPWIALALLLYLGIHMIVSACTGKEEEQGNKKLTVPGLLLQGIATSIDALSVGFVIAAYDFIHVLVAALIIAAVTYAVCRLFLIVGKKVGVKHMKPAAVIGGIILIAIGLEIFIKGVFFG